MYSEEITGIVLDIGSSSIRAGYSGDDTPKYVIASKSMVKDKTNNTNGLQMEVEQSSKDNKDSKESKQQENLYNNKEVLFGDEFINARREGTQLKDLVSQGCIIDFDLYEKCLQDIFQRQLRIKPDQYPLIQTESINVTQQQRLKQTEIVFEQLQSINYFTCKSPVLSSFSLGRSTSIVFDSGEQLTYAIPVMDGYPLTKNIVKNTFAGQWVTQKVTNYIEKTYQNKIEPRFCYNIQIDKEANKIYEYTGWAKYDKSYYQYQLDKQCNYIKEALLFIDEEELMSKNERNYYELPDGKLVQLKEYRNIIVESLFEKQSNKKTASISIQQSNDNQNHYEDFKGYQHMLMDSVNKTDIDLRKDLFSNIILVGGNTLIHGFDELFHKKIIDLVPTNFKTRLITHPTSNERLFAPWIGASILSSLGTFQNMWICKQEYEEHGSYIINKKCP